jgi:hypothetical protein
VALRAGALHQLRRQRSGVKLRDDGGDCQIHDMCAA